jgi:hypothetical protein
VFRTTTHFQWPAACDEGTANRAHVRGADCEGTREIVFEKIFAPLLKGNFFYIVFEIGMISLNTVPWIAVIDACIKSYEIYH